MPENCTDVLSGMVFVTAGRLVSKRAELTKLIEKNGGVLKKDVTKAVTHMTSAAEDGSAKVKKAESNGATVLTEAEFMIMLGKDPRYEMDKPLLWNDFHPAKILLRAEIMGGAIPLDATEMGPAVVYCACAQTNEFKMKGMECGPTFKRRLNDLRAAMGEDKRRADTDLIAIKRGMANHPVPKLNHKGRVQWNGSLAQGILKCDMKLGRHKKMSPAQLRESRLVHKRTLSPNSFRWKIRQEERTMKYLHTLEYRANQKLREYQKDLGSPEPVE